MHVGAKLDRSSSQVGVSWAAVGVLVAEVDPSTADVLAMSDRNDAFGRFWADCKMRKFPQWARSY